MAAELLLLLLGLRLLLGLNLGLLLLVRMLLVVMVHLGHLLALDLLQLGSLVLEPNLDDADAQAGLLG